MMFYVLTDISVYLVGDRATRGHAEQTALYMSCVTSIVIGLTVAAMRKGRSGVWECVSPINVFRLLPVAASFHISLVGLLKSFPHFDGAFIKLVGQMKLPITAFLSAVVLKRKYSLVQWQIIICICIACTSFTALRLGSRISIGPMPVVGLCWVFTWVVFNALATLFAERSFKQDGALPFYTVMTNLRFGELLTISATLWLDSELQLNRFFAGWNWTTVAVTCTLVGDAWFSGLIVSRLSSVTKNVCKCCTVVVLYVIALLTGKQSPVFSQILGAMMIVQLTATFALLSVQKQPALAA